jgi:protein-L-isoaspartate(D-aspartate) O-methyltransferase
MLDFAAARRMMVDGQVRTSDVTDLRIIAAMLEIPRERFVPGTNTALAISISMFPRSSDGPGRVRRCSSHGIAKMGRLPRSRRPTRCSMWAAHWLFGRPSCVLAQSVVASRRIRPWRRLRARSSVGASNATVVTGPLTGGWQPKAPQVLAAYDVIFVNGAIEVVPHALCAQLKEGGRLLVVSGRAPNGRAMVYRSVADDASGWPIFDAAAPLLPGFAKPPAFVF